jgi:hypothetical protein
MLTVRALCNRELIEKAHALPRTGCLEQRGYYSFLNIADSFIHELYPMLVEQQYFMKPNYDIGAHITFTYQEESLCVEACDVGKVHTFEVQELWSAVLAGKEYIVLMVAAPSLGALRLKYGLHPQPKYKNERIDFHITLAVRSL